MSKVERPLPRLMSFDVFGTLISVRDSSYGAFERILAATSARNVDVRAFSHASIVLLTLAILVAVVISKIAGCGLGALRLGRKEALRVGVGMLPRGEVCVAVARLGLTLGIIRQSMYSVVILVAVAAAALAPPLLNIAFRNVPIRREPGEEVYRVG